MLWPGGVPCVVRPARDAGRHGRRGPPRRTDAPRGTQGASRADHAPLRFVAPVPLLSLCGHAAPLPRRHRRAVEHGLRHARPLRPGERRPRRRDVRGGRARGCGDGGWRGAPGARPPVPVVRRTGDRADLPGALQGPARPGGPLPEAAHRHEGRDRPVRRQAGDAPRKPPLVGPPRVPRPARQNPSARPRGRRRRCGAGPRVRVRHHRLPRRGGHPRGRARCAPRHAARPRLRARRRRRSGVPQAARGRQGPPRAPPQRRLAGVA